MVQENLDRNAYAEAGQATEADIKLNALEQEITPSPDPGRAQSRTSSSRKPGRSSRRQMRVRREIQSWKLPSPASRPRKSPRSARSARSFSPRGIQKVKHSINWRQYKKDDLAVKLAVSEAGR